MGSIPHHWKDSVCLNCHEAGSFIGPCLPGKGELEAEIQRHEFTLSKWFQERKELTDELVKTRMELGGARERIHDLENPS